MSKILCLVKEPAKPIKFASLDNELHALQSVVGGYIEVHTLNKHIAVICNEEGRLQRLPYCCSVDGLHFVGPVIFVGVEGEEFASLWMTLEEIERYIPEEDKLRQENWPC